MKDLKDWELVLDYFEKHKGKGITQNDATKLGITRLAARISDLEHKGYVIRHEREPNIVKRGFHARYFLEEEVGA